MARYSAFLGRAVEVQYRAGDICLPASGTFVRDSGRSIFLEQHYEQLGQLKNFRWEIPYQCIVRLEEVELPASCPASLSEEAPAARDSEVLRGDLVGPGPGVIEPELTAPPRVNYPPVARQQRVSGRVILLVLVDENGGVSEVKLQQGVASKLGVNEAVVEGVRKSKFKPATKNGVPVKMWRTVVVDVQP